LAVTASSDIWPKHSVIKDKQEQLWLLIKIYQSHPRGLPGRHWQLQPPQIPTKHATP